MTKSRKHTSPDSKLASFSPSRGGTLPATDSPLPLECREAVEHLRASLQAGRAWPEAFVEAMGLWTLPQEVRRGRLYRYLIDGEAFDWELLAHRLCEEVDGLAPPGERARLFLIGPGHPDFHQAGIRRLLGPAKYRAFLNYWYGVIVEQALQRAVEEEICKERASRALSSRRRVHNDAFLQLYGEGAQALEEAFRRERGLSDGGPLGENKEFIYWRFKLRLKRCEKARVASDTRKALEWLQRQERSS